jgi:DNA polymerase
MQGIVDQWRAANPHIVKLWRRYELAAMTALNDHRDVRCQHGVTFRGRKNLLLVQLPSGRWLMYWGARVREDEKTGRQQVVYMGVNQTTKQWGEAETYGGKLVENVVQATARDCLAEAMKRVTGAGYSIVMHVHDEIIVDVPKDDTAAADVITRAMCEDIPWAPGLPIRGETYETEFYKKD